MNEYGVKIKKIKSTTLYEKNLGVRDYYSYTNAMFTNNLLCYYLLDNGLKVNKQGYTQDIICLDFDFGTRSYEQTISKMSKSLEKLESEENINQENINNLKAHIKSIEDNKDKFKKITKGQIREEYYKDGVEIEYLSYKKNGEVNKRTTIHYKMLYRSTGKAKNGSCIFICDKLYKKAHDFIYMGIKLPKKNAPIVEMSAYCSLIASSIIDTIKINPKNILILKDVDVSFKTNVMSIDVDCEKYCIIDNVKDYELSNTLFDGQSLIDSSIFPKWANGFVLLRHHMTKTAAFNSDIQGFFKDYFGEDYNQAKVTDMFGNQHYAKDIELITTDNSVKWLKFGISYEYWCDRVFDNNCMFGIVKTAHASKLGEVQRMSYQMTNSLDIEIIDNAVKKSVDYINLIKRDNYAFLDYLKNNTNFVNDFDVLIALCEQNWEFTRSDYFRKRKKCIINSYLQKIKSGKIIQNGDNLVIVGSPYAMLLHSVGEDVYKDDTFKQNDNYIECHTKQFECGESIAGFRSPFNARNNMTALKNVFDERLEKYFDITEQIIAVNMIGTDFQDRNNGSDQDSDSLYCTNQVDIANHAIYCYNNYPTIVNNIPAEKTQYDNTIENYALIDNKLASTQMAIGESSNLAQIALTYTYNFNDKIYSDCVCILSVVAQICIDSAKRCYDIDINSEIKRIKKLLNVEENKYPVFWLNIRKGFPLYNINYELDCPMNRLMNIKPNTYRSTESTLPMDYFFKDFKLEKSRKKSKKIEELIEKYSLKLLNTTRYENDKDNFNLLQSDFDELIEDIKTVYISKTYIGLMSWLVDRAFCITNDTKLKSKDLGRFTDNNKAILLKVLFAINSDNLLKIFGKNEEKDLILTK